MDTEGEGRAQDVQSNGNDVHNNNLDLNEVELSGATVQCLCATLRQSVLLWNSLCYSETVCATLGQSSVSREAVLRMSV
uniref:(California timema) hypothetical protein n=1 Tax=Timema californicum TaxID=61474 RepID=A0A7R9PD84_TIMCA|nr:unnamed protein product [Timema californicum]